jgi:cellulose synthase/poly-beta-1,6-N-acetylglucosamine synthase-like glycosyltransferase
VIVLSLAHAALAFWLTLYGLNTFLLAFLYLRAHRRSTPTPAVDESLPKVTVQIPVYNERHVVERVIDATANFDYPRDRLQIQILDDSTDDTTKLACARAAYHRQRGVDVAVLQRDERRGFKAGALAWGLSQAEGTFIAVFDADFCPRPDFLRRTIPHFLANPRLGMAQTRWSYLNAEYSPLTRVQAMMLDGHFVVEQTARNHSGLLMSFNGTGGVWRRRCIEEVGGWQADTLCEDLDLSYRAQLAGWQCRYLPAVNAPAEVPPQIAAFKRQQSRWAQGSVQTLRKLAVPILRNRDLNWGQKVMGLLHLSNYLAHPLMVLLLLVSLPILLIPDCAPIPMAGLGLMCMGPPLVYALSQKALYPDWMRRLWALPLLALVGIGIAWSNTRAVWRGLTRWGGAFERTPKFQLEGRAGQWTSSRYRLPVDGGVVSDFIGEVILTLYALTSAAFAYASQQREMLPFLLFYAAAFGVVAGLGVGQGIAARNRFRPNALIDKIKHWASIWVD